MHMEVYMQPINLNVPIYGNCDNFNCCFPRIKPRKSKSQDEKIKDVAVDSLKETEAVKAKVV